MPGEQHRGRVLHPWALHPWALHRDEWDWCTPTPESLLGNLEKCPYIPREELATRSISTVFRARGLCLAFSFLLVAST